MTTRKEQAELMRKRIIEVGEELIRKNGYESIRISDIARECKMSSGNFYHYFSSIKDLIETIDDIKFYESFSSMCAQSNKTVLSRIDSYFSDWINLTLSYYNSQYMYHWTRHYILNTTPESSQNRIKLIAKHLDNILRTGIRDGELMENTPVEQISYSIAFAIFGCSAHFGVTADEDFIRSWREYFSETYVKNAIAHYLVK